MPSLDLRSSWIQGKMCLDPLWKSHLISFFTRHYDNKGISDLKARLDYSYHHARRKFEFSHQFVKKVYVNFTDFSDPMAKLFGQEIKNPNFHNVLHGGMNNPDKF